MSKVLAELEELARDVAILMPGADDARHESVLWIRATVAELLHACLAMDAHYSASLDYQPHYVSIARAAIAKATGEAA